MIRKDEKRPLMMITNIGLKKNLDIVLRIDKEISQHSSNASGSQWKKN